MKTTGQQFSETLKEIGIRYVFGVPSGSMIDYMEAIRKTDGIDFILVSHEAAAGFMASVCGRLNRIPGACFATFGPGATNLSTGVGAALLDRSPLLAFTDELPEEKRHRTVQMNIDLQALFKPITKWTTRLEAGRVKKTLLAAAKIAGTGLPGPVHIGVPSNISSLKIREEQTVLKPSPGIKPAPAAVMETMRQAVLKAKKPLVVIGLTAVQSQLKPLILEVVEKFGLPVVLTPMAKGMVPEDHPLYVGVLNHALANMVAQTHQQADLIIGIGYDPVEVNYEDWIPKAPIVHISIVPADLDTYNCKLAADVVGDMQVSLQSFLVFPRLNHAWDLEALLKRKQKMFAALKAPDMSFGPLAVLEGLRDILPKDGILTCDVGAHLHLIGQKWPTPEPGCLLMTNGWSSMGFAIPAAIAAKLCCPDKKVACVMGDGGFLMAAGEMATAQRLGLHIIFILLSDNELALIRIKQTRKNYPSYYGTRLFEKDYPDSDHFLGVPVLNASDQAAYKAALQKAVFLTGPVIIKASVTSSEYDDLVLQKNR
ncbi:MAG: thiamine pyrophosphate-binding protein [Proteobacteria bacterium]|nr:thiamine pyrophosphate-binding protein [Pseudomonadota bacterium]MBU1582831.1 thiamine pyrophosphate-binding protein [Pseudomonadota bacterium]MBU2451830.1 thiamine pyrophosphate-binding protein [Pseudomonadota bacterium]MBU2631019.1 thiamine pyrophosphate-binding protein [Pseudomonadota bacterium]